jgi:4-nitrophenyl phosphatase
MGQDYLKSISGLILDMDGVLWRADQAIGDLPEIFSQMQALGLKVVLATNNATLTSQQYQEKLRQFGVELMPEQIVNSAMAVAHHLNREYPAGGPVFVIGETGLHSALEEKNFYQADFDVQAVVVGMDRKLTYERLSQATLLIRSGVPFIATNADRTFPVPGGLIPGVGAILALLEVASEVKPYVAGKPRPEMYLVALERMGLKPGQVMVVGDRLETDIAGAQEIGCLTALVLSGVTGLQAASAWHPTPDWVGPDLTALVSALQD